MGSDSIVDVPLPSSFPNSKDLGKKKRANRLAKLKQCKLDVRREQWLSQVKNKGCKDETNVRGESPLPYRQLANEESKSLDSFKSRSGEEETEGLNIHNRNLESLIEDQTESSLVNNDSRKVLSGSNSVTGSDSCSGSVSKEEEDEGLDDWEALADALNADDNHQLSSILNSPAKFEPRDVLIDHGLCNKNSVLDLSKAESRGKVAGSGMNPQAWMPNDAFRPQSLPSLSKLAKTDWHCGRRAITWAWQSIMSQPSSCPNCCEDLDVTDSSFLPCPCGFKLCLFCHKRIIESDGRCPGCRKQYDLVNRDIMGFNGESRSFQVVHSYSMSTRS